MKFHGRFIIVFMISLLGSIPSFAWEHEAMTALFANAETVLKANQLVESGRPVFGAIEHRVLSKKPGTSENPFPVIVEEFTFEVNASFGDAIAQIGKLTIYKTTTRYPRSPGIEYATKIETYPTGVILR